jgi:alkylation response protein AidB-like acyl-CoA dehydrogenase
MTDASSYDGSDDQRLIRQTIRDLLDREASLERVSEWDEESSYPQDFFARLAELGFTGATFAGDEASAAEGVLQAMIVTEEIGTRGLDFAAGYSLNEFLGMNIRRHGTDEQRDRLLGAVAMGDMRFSIAMTEPAAGSDAAGIRLSAKPDGDGFRLNGQKVFITGGGLDNTLLHVTAITDPDAGRRKGMTVFLVPNDAAGVDARRLKTVGRHILGTCEVFFNDVRVERSQILGQLDDGWNVLGSGLAMERLFACAAYVGAHRQVFELMRDYVNERHQFGQSIGSFQAMSHPIADTYCDYEASRALTYRAGALVAEGKDALQALSVAKLFGSEALQRATQIGMQAMGGYGFMTEYPMQRFWREARVATVTAGTSEIQRTIISRGLGVRGTVGRA